MDSARSARASVRDVYEAHARACEPDNFLGQVKHTVAGKPISEDQVALIAQSVLRGLDVQPSDRVLDLCCGNGALTTRVFEVCAGGLGVDFTPTLIAVANRHFVRRPQEAFRLQDVLDFVETAENPETFTKMLCHGGFQYLPASDGRELLASLYRRFSNVTRVFLGNLPDKSRMDAFFGDRDRPPGLEDDSTSPFGLWRTENEIKTLSTSAGWTSQILHMSNEYYASHYRFDVLLSR